MSPVPRPPPLPSREPLSPLSSFRRTHSGRRNENVKLSWRGVAGRLIGCMTCQTTSVPPSPPLSLPCDDLLKCRPRSRSSAKWSQRKTLRRRLNHLPLPLLLSSKTSTSQTLQLQLPPLMTHTTPSLVKKKSFAGTSEPLTSRPPSSSYSAPPSRSSPPPLPPSRLLTAPFSQVHHLGRLRWILSPHSL